MIDWSHIDELKQDMEDAFDEVVEAFLLEASDGVARLEAAVPAQTLAADLHFLRGAALNLGFAEFAALCGEGEAQANAGQAAQVDLAAIRASFEASRQALASGLRTRAA
ncbi:Hpt domain-containing protein [Pararhodobacter oceanensis]|uniref:Hpt domain-containing protein n=1 Tax=Pararhodobacter oceanensis TaxID=2172121 RepID=UPI003A950FBE